MRSLRYLRVRTKREFLAFFEENGLWRIVFSNLIYIFIVVWVTLCGIIWLASEVLLLPHRIVYGEISDKDLEDFE